MIGYKLFRVRKDGSLGPLFINRRQRLVVGEWYEAEDHPTPGFAFRTGWHICSKPFAPHLSTRGRRWYAVEFDGWTNKWDRPRSQGGMWWTAQYMRIVRPVRRK